jgi:hypothetical protein
LNRESTLIEKKGNVNSLKMKLPVKYERLLWPAVLLPTLVAVFAWIFCGYSWTGSGSNLSGVQAKEVPQFDCFSRPAIAAAILRQEADRCLLEYDRARELKKRIDQQQLMSPDRTQWKGQLDLTSRTHDEGLSDARPVLIVAPVSSVEDLDRSITELKNDLDRRLMLVYFENNLSNKFLNFYLNQAQGAPDGNAVVWARYALECSRTCGRTAEVLDAMRHLSQFRAEVKGLKGLQAVLDDWPNHDSLAQKANPR